MNSITRLPVEEAYSLAKSLSKYAGTSFTSFSRFTSRDFDGYYKKRIRTEDWLYKSFIALGGKPKTIAPLYFVLGESNYLSHWFENGTRIKLLFSDIDSDDISFTFGDSMSKMDSEDRIGPFNKETLFQFLNEKCNDIMAFLDELNKQNRYIEVQLWNDSYIEKALK